MRYILRSAVPPITRVLLVESGARELTERFAPVLRLVCGGAVDVDMFTCLGAPESTSAILPRQIYRSQDYPDRRARSSLLRLLRENDYQAIVLFCADSPLLYRWKWWLALRLPAKVLVANENADCFWLDIANWRGTKEMLAARYGLQGAASFRTLAGVTAFPFVLGWLLLYAALAHTRRGMRILFRMHRTQSG